MKPRILIAGIGNIFFGDDGFGVAVAQQLAREPLPEHAVVRDTGIRGVHLAFELLEGWELLIVIDAVATGAPAGTLHLIEPNVAARIPGTDRDAHGMDLPVVLQLARSLGAPVFSALIVGCSVQDTREHIGLSPKVERAVPEAARLVQSLVRWPDPAQPSLPRSRPGSPGAGPIAKPSPGGPSR